MEGLSFAEELCEIADAYYISKFEQVKERCIEAAKKGQYRLQCRREARHLFCLGHVLVLI